MTASDLTINLSSRAKCVLVGGEALAVQCALMLRDTGVDVAAVVSDSAEVLTMADAEGFTTDDRVGALEQVIRDADATVLVSAAHLAMVPAAALDAVDVAVNFHDGPLPRYAGLNVTTWTIHDGCERHGVAWHLMEGSADTGAVLAADEFPIAANDTAFTLNAACYEAGVRTFGSVAAMLAAGSVVASPQPAGERVLHRRRERPVVVIDPTSPSEPQARTARALDVGDRVDDGVGVPRLLVGDAAYAVRVVTASDAAGPPGRIDRADDVLRVATADGALDLSGLVDLADGRDVTPPELVARHGLSLGARIDAPAPDLIDALVSADPTFADHEPAHRAVLTRFEPSRPPRFGAGPSSASLDRPTGVDDDAVLDAVGRWLAVVSPDGTVGFTVTDPQVRARLDRFGSLVRPPLVSVDPAAPVSAAVRAALAAGPFLADLGLRTPSGRDRDLAADVRVDLGRTDPTSGFPIHLAIDDQTVRLTVDADQASADRFAGQLAVALADPHARTLLGSADRAVLDALNDTGRMLDTSATVDGLFRSVAASQPETPAVSCGEQSVTYAELALRVDALAAALREAGVGAGDLVGVALPRSADLVASTLAVMRCGAAYVPLDPDYPKSRIAFMLDDADLRVVITTADTMSGTDRTVVDPAAVPSAPAGVDPVVDHGGDDLAYVIYTSGSTGVPKGVELRHRNVVNFFDAMDEVLAPDPDAVWLAVTSLSFDISVLELLWTLTRGLHVVVKQHSGMGAAATGPVHTADFSIFYFGAGEGIADDGYHFVRESAGWADRNGFEAAWIPERHFHAFGAPYPNPSVLGAAIAAITERLGVRSGSIVLPLHNPVRVAEEWAVVDQLSRGRVGLSFAPGWQINDFVLNPEAWETARTDLEDRIDIVRRLWRGETVTLPGPRGDVEVATHPRPVQDELPIWLTSAGSRATFERGGRMGVNLLTHLLGQSVDDLAANIDAYRRARAEAGHDGPGRVTVMVHTYLDEDGDEARRIAREPLKGYLGTAAGLLKNIASEFPTFRGSGADADEAFRSLDEEELGLLLDMAADRYLGTSGLFGTVEEGIDMAASLTAAGADEIACLIDFGVDASLALAGLDRIGKVRDGLLARAAAAPDEEPETVASLIERHHVTHLQCTPSLAEMLVADPADHAALSSLRHLLLGGEALPVGLARELRGLLRGRFTNMYGPTETTIWSLVHEIETVDGGTVPIGRPIGNTTISVRDEAGNELPVGVWGELHIGGDGVARGYRGRPELTAERFVDRGDAITYATGDVVRVHPDGRVEFGGRGDGQVKIRGHRIELGEIEAVIDELPSVARSVVAPAPDQPSSLVAFVLPADGTVDAAEIIEQVAGRLPDAMVPSAVVALTEVPLTPNGKVDRKALPHGRVGAPVVGDAADLEGTQAMVAEVWAAVLGRAVGPDENFFDIGGHSLRAVAVFRQVGERVEAPIALTDVFRFPTVRTFAAHLDAQLGVAVAPADPAPGGGAPDRGELRRRARQRRGASS